MDCVNPTYLIDLNLTPKGQMSMWRPNKTSGHMIVNVIFT
jgi:hypothetical protein